MSALCLGTIVIHDDRMGGWTDYCQLPAAHDGEHGVAYNACEPKAWLRWSDERSDG